MRGRRRPLCGAARKRIREKRVLAGLREPRPGEYDAVVLALMRDVRDAQSRGLVALDGDDWPEADDHALFASASTAAAAQQEPLPAQGAEQEILVKEDPTPQDEAGCQDDVGHICSTVVPAAVDSCSPLQSEAHAAPIGVASSSTTEPPVAEEPADGTLLGAPFDARAAGLLSRKQHKISDADPPFHLTCGVQVPHPPAPLSPSPRLPVHSQLPGVCRSVQVSVAVAVFVKMLRLAQTVLSVRVSCG